MDKIPVYVEAEKIRTLLKEVLEDCLATCPNQSAQSRAEGGRGALVCQGTGRLEARTRDGHVVRPDPLEMMRQGELLDLLKVGRSTLWKWIKEGSFPKPLKLGPRTTAWRKEDLDHWMRKRGGEER
jgi:prophage regulatory protein